MKKITKVLLCLLSITIITGCISNKHLDDIQEKLKKEKIIDKNSTLIYEIKYTYKGLAADVPISDIMYYDFVYKNKKSNEMFLIRVYDKTEYNSETKDVKYNVSKYKINSIDEFVEITNTYDGSNYYDYKDSDGNKKTYTNHIYENDLSDEIKYEVIRSDKKIWIFSYNKWKVNKID